MNLLELFKDYLFSQKKKPSNITVKNYLADVRHFIVWFEKQYNVVFEPTLINDEHWKQFKKAKTPQLSENSLERHLSSLRKFFSFLLATNNIQSNPFIINNIYVLQKQKDPWKLDDFKDSLKKDKAAKPTIKNYVTDIKQFLSWIEGNKREEILSPEEIVPYVNNYFLEQYKHILLDENRFSETSIKRKLSSIKKYIQIINKHEELGSRNYAVTPSEFETSLEANQLKKTNVEILPNLQSEALPSEILQENKPLSYNFLEDKNNEKDYLSSINKSTKQTIPKSAKKNTYSKIPPIRLIQKLYKLSNLCIDYLLVIPLTLGIRQADHAMWVAKGKPVFAKRLLQLPQPALEYLHEVKKIPLNTIDTLKDNIRKLLNSIIIPEKVITYRPAWYHRYHSYSVAHYFHFAILVIFMSAIGFNIYAGFFDAARSKPVFASLPTAPPKLLSFKGHLTDKNNNPITTRTNVRFAVYNSRVASGSALLWQEIDPVLPDKQGNIALALGSKSFLDQTMFDKHSGLWLGVTVEHADELRPREQLATTALAANTQTLQGMSAITNENAGTKNVVLALDSGGNLTIGGSDDHTFQATGGQLKLSGNTLVLTTNPGSSTDVQINPDGFGNLDIQKPIHNTSNNNNIASAMGSVEVDDTFAILATTSGQSAFTINQNGGGPLISASSSGIAKFTITNDGSITAAGNFSLAGDVASNLVPFGNNLNLGTNASQWNNLFVKSIYLNGAPLTQPWQENKDSVLLVNQTKNLLIGLTASTSANFQVIASTGAILTQGSIGIGTQTIPNNTALFIQKNSSTNALVIADQQGINTFTIGSNGNTRITGGFLCVSSDDKCITNPSHSSGTLYASHTKVENADLAENYISSQTLEPGDLVMPANDGNNLAVIKTTSQYQPQIIGVVSTKPGVTLNSDALTDGGHPYLFPIALSGRVPVKVSIANGIVRTGDLLTASAVPGVAMRATKAGPIIGKALEDFTDQNPGKVMAYISVTWGDPTVSLADNGNLNTANQLVSNLNSDQVNLLVKLLNEITNGTKIMLGNLYAGVISAKNIAADTLTIHNSLTSPIANIQEAHSKLISPLSDTGKIALTLDDSRIQIHNNNTATSAAVTTFDNQGNASFSGQVNSNSLNINQDATISGVLHASKIIADQIVGLHNPATNSAQYITNVTNIYTATPSANVSSNINQTAPNSDLLSTNYRTNKHGYMDIASYSGYFSTVSTLHVTNATFEQGLISLGPTSLSDTSITGQLSIGSQFVFADNSINVLGGDLELQPLKQGGVSIAGRQVYIDTNGNVSFNGNATFNGNLAANGISPLPNHDLLIKLDNGKTDGSAANFKITNASSSAIFTVNQLGDIIASGAATIKKLNFVTQQALAVSENEIIASGSAGVATISAHHTQLLIDNPAVTDKSLIYITPVGNTNQTPYLLRQSPHQSFTVGIQQSLLFNTVFNWLIIN